MAEGNDGNYLQHCVEVEAAVRLSQAGHCGRLHVALTHGMEPFEKLKESNVQKDLLYSALEEASGEPKCAEREIVKAYRGLGASHQRYPNTAKLLRTVVKDGLSGGITEACQTKCKELAKDWSGSEVQVAHSSWREQLLPDGALSCPDKLNMPWLFSMDPRSYSEASQEDNEKLYRSDRNLLVGGLGPYFNSGQPGIACLFVYGMGSQKDSQRQFWAFMDDLARQLDAATGSYWVHHNGGNRNLAGLLFSDQELAWGFAPPRIVPGRGHKRPG